MAKWAVERQRAMTVRPLFEYLERSPIYNQAGLARQMGMTKQRLYQIKKGLVPTPDGFVAIACAELGISPKLLGKPTLPAVPQPRRQRKSA